MTKKKPPKRRRNPAQDRSRATVDAIVEATAQVLLSHGYERTSTNRIAARAGVSIGSLYQYFDNKDAIILALIERHFAQLEAILAEHVGASPTTSLQERTAALLRALIQVHRIDPRLNQIIQQEIPRVGDLARIDEFESRAEDGTVAVLSAMADEMRPVDTRLAARIIVRAVGGVIQTTMRRDPDQLERPEFLDELVALTTRYLLL